MSPVDQDDRLSRIATRWTAVFRAHGDAPTQAEAARHRLMLHYSGAVYRYLLGAVRDPDVAADLCQEFAVRFLRGDFRRADPGRGRFRDYLKTVAEPPGERPPPGPAGRAGAAGGRRPGRRPLTRRTNRLRRRLAAGRARPDLEGPGGGEPDVPRRAAVADREPGHAVAGDGGPADGASSASR